MGYIRHRNRQVHASVINDVRDLLTAKQWMGPALLPLIKPPGMKIVEFIAEDSAQQGKKLEPNLLAIDVGTPFVMEEMELGGAVFLQPYKIAMALYAESDAVGASVMQDLADRYNMLLRSPKALALYDYGMSPPELVQNLDIESFVFLRSPVASQNVNSFWLAELQISDYVSSEE